MARRVYTPPSRPRRGANIRVGPADAQDHLVRPLGAAGLGKFSADADGAVPARRGSFVSAARSARLAAYGRDRSRVEGVEVQTDFLVPQSFRSASLSGGGWVESESTVVVSQASQTFVTATMPATGGGPDRTWVYPSGYPEGRFSPPPFVPPTGTGPFPTGSVWYGIAANTGTGLVLAVGQTVNALTGSWAKSYDHGATWLSGSLGGGFLPTMVRFGNNGFFGVHASGVFITTDGGVWITRSLTATQHNQTSIDWNGTLYVTVGPTSTYYRSDANFTSWVSGALPFGPSGNIYSVVAHGPKFIAVGASTSISGVAATSTDGTGWSSFYTIDPTGGSTQGGPTYAWVIWSSALGRFVAVGDDSISPPFGGRIATSPDGVSWSAFMDTFTVFKSISENPSIVVSVGFSGSGAGITYTTNGTVWNAIVPPTSALLLESVTWDGGEFIAVGHDIFYETGTIARSTDGITWT